MDIQTRIDSLTEETISELAEAGCSNFFIGIETFAKPSLQSMHKGTINEESKVRGIFQQLLQHGINPTASIITGKYAGGLENFHRTLEKLKEFGAMEIFIQAGAVYPGTGDWRHMSSDKQRNVVLIQDLQTKPVKAKISARAI